MYFLFLFTLTFIKLFKINKKGGIKMFSKMPLEEKEKYLKGNIDFMSIEEKKKALRFLVVELCKCDILSPRYSMISKRMDAIEKALEDELKFYSKSSLNVFAIE